MWLPEIKAQGAISLKNTYKKPIDEKAEVKNEKR
jgi:hypothetical protein